jgi:hypothetical protein
MAESQEMLKKRFVHLSSTLPDSNATCRIITDFWQAVSSRDSFHRTCSIGCHFEELVFCCQSLRWVSRTDTCVNFQKIRAFISDPSEKPVGLRLPFQNYGT